jgi:hypothetical protein
MSSLTSLQKRGLWAYTEDNGPWCHFCALPQNALRLENARHDFKKCPWSDIITGVAWSVWHNRLLFERMQMELKCSVSLGTTSSTDEQKLDWCKWLKEISPDETAYNVHNLWLWYCRTMLEYDIPQLP